MTVRRQRFEDLYQKSIDPWHFRASAYEREKYHQTIQALPKARYESGIEAGCSIGELSRQLGERCHSFCGLDISQIAIDEARRRNIDKPNLQFLRADLPKQWPTVQADVIVLSEFLYYLNRDEIADLAQRMANSWRVGGDCVVVSFLGETSELLQGAEAAELMLTRMGDAMSLQLIKQKALKDYRIDVVRRAEAV